MSRPPNIYGTISEFNLSLDRREKEQMISMAKRWGEVESRLSIYMQRHADALQARREAGLPISITAQSRMETYKELMRQAAIESTKYQQYADNIITQEQLYYAETGVAAAQTALKNELGAGVSFNRINTESAVANMIGAAGDGSPLFSVLQNRAIAPEAVEGLQNALIEGVALGYSPRKTAQLMADGLAQGLNKALVIARTEQIRAYRTASLDQYRASGQVTAYQRHAAPSERTCLACIALDGKVYPSDADFASHPNCILPGNEVLVPDLIGASKAFYVGRAIEFTFDSGRKISVTENHPILTPLGFVSAKFLHSGDNVISARNAERILNSIDPDNNYVPTVIEKIFSTFKKSRGVVSRTMPTSPEDFHGDARLFNGDVDIVNVNSLLLNSDNSAIGKVDGQKSFGGRDVIISELITDSPRNSFDNGDDAPRACNVCGAHLISSLSLTHSSPFERLGFALVSDVDAAFNKSLAKGSPTHTELEREFVLRFASDITTDCITDVRYFDFSGHVYDLQTRMYELYICNGVVVKNCRCFMTPVIASVENPSRSTESWLTRQDEATQRKILGGHYDAYKSGVPLADMVKVKNDPTWGATIGVVPLKDLQKD